MMKASVRRAKKKIQRVNNGITDKRITRASSKVASFGRTSVSYSGEGGARRGSENTPADFGTFDSETYYR